MVAQLIFASPYHTVTDMLTQHLDCSTRRLEAHVFSYTQVLSRIPYHWGIEHSMQPPGPAYQAAAAPEVIRGAGMTTLLMW